MIKSWCHLRLIASFSPRKLSENPPRSHSNSSCSCGISKTQNILGTFLPLFATSSLVSVQSLPLLIEIHQNEIDAGDTMHYLGILQQISQLQRSNRNRYAFSFGGIAINGTLQSLGWQPGKIYPVGRIIQPQQRVFRVHLPEYVYAAVPNDTISDQHVVRQFTINNLELYTEFL